MQDCKFIGRIIAGLAVIFSQFLIFAHAQDSLHDGVELRLIYPESVVAGKPFHVYALIHNGSERNLIYPVITHPDWTESGYSYRRCIDICPGLSGIDTGETRFMYAGVFYSSGEVLTTTQLLIDDLSFASLDSTTVKLEETAFDRISVDIIAGTDVGAPNPDLYPVPERQVLQIRDHAQLKNALLHDPNTGYDWLRLDSTINMTASEVLDALQPGGKFDGFDFARASQVETLMLNHIHAQNLKAQIYDLYSTPPPALRSAIREFITLIHPTQTVATSNTLAAAVADRALSYGFPEMRISSVSVFDVSSGTCACGPSGGMRLQSWNQSLWDYPQPNAGVWLVRGAELPERPQTKANLFDKELFIPDVQIDGISHRVYLRLTDNATGVFQLLEAQAIEPGSDPLILEGNPARLTLPQTEIIQYDGSRQRAQLTLELIPHTSPPALLLVGLEYE